MRSEQETSVAIDRYADTVRRICVLYLKDSADTEDIFQEVFLKYALCNTVFENEDHEKAWLIKVTMNRCKDFLRSFFVSRTVPLESVAELMAELPPDHSEVLTAVLELPKKYKEVIYLHYYEGYTAPEIGALLGRNVNTVYTLINRGKTLLKKKLEGIGYGK